MKIQNCGNCKFWKIIGHFELEGILTGECLQNKDSYYPPIYSLNENEDQNKSPSKVTHLCTPENWICPMWKPVDNG